MRISVIHSPTISISDKAFSDLAIPDLAISDIPTGRW